MLTKLAIKNFKRFDEVEIPLASPVVFVGPNNSGKTTALQALALWELGLRRWKEKRSEKGTPEKRPGVAINRRDLLTVPAPAANLLWKDLHVRNVQRKNGSQETQNIRIDVLVEGDTSGAPWSCGLEFDFSNDESFFCRPLRLEDKKGPSRMPIPEAAYDVRVAFLPPMSGLTAHETLITDGAINVRLGEGRTAEVLRNLCYALAIRNDRSDWRRVVSRVQDLFHVTLDHPEYISERGEILMTYQQEKNRLDLSSSGRGLQQTLLLVSYLELNPGSVLLLDEPDAHLEVLRQRDIFRLLTETARDNGSQLIIASHSEAVLNEAAGLNPDSVVAFLGKPHRVAAGKTEAVRKALTAIRFDQYYLAEQRGWVLYLEGATDLSVLQAFAKRLGHLEAQKALVSPFVCPVGNQPNKGREHFNALVEAKPNLTGFLLVDRDAGDLQQREELREHKWQRREIENYLCQPATLEAFAASFGSEDTAPLFQGAESERAAEAMRESIKDLVPPVALRDPSDPWWRTVKATGEFLDRVFPAFYERLNLTLGLRKADYHRLVEFIPEHLLDPEVAAVLDAIADTAAKAKPAQ